MLCVWIVQYGDHAREQPQAINGGSSRTFSYSATLSARTASNVCCVLLSCSASAAAATHMNTQRHIKHVHILLSSTVQDMLQHMLQVALGSCPCSGRAYVNCHRHTEPVLECRSHVTTGACCVAVGKSCLARGSAKPTNAVAAVHAKLLEWQWPWPQLPGLLSKITALRSNQCGNYAREARGHNAQHAQHQCWTQHTACGTTNGWRSTQNDSSKESPTKRIR